MQAAVLQSAMQEPKCPILTELASGKEDFLGSVGRSAN